jgi:hypothetical protein
MKTLTAIMGGLLLTLSCVTASDARVHAKRQAQDQSQPTYYDRQPTYFDRDSSGADCPIYHCNINAGG